MAGSGPRHSPDDYSDTSLKDGLYMMCLFIYIYSVYGYEYMYVYIYIYIYIYMHQVPGPADPPPMGRVSIFRPGWSLLGRGSHIHAN